MSTLSVKNLKEYIEKVAHKQSENLIHSEELYLCLGGGRGGGRFVAEFAFLNTQDKSITIHPMLIFEGSDCRENLLGTQGKLAPQISRLEGATINVKGRQLRLKIFALFDLCALNAVLENKAAV